MYYYNNRKPPLKHIHVAGCALAIDREIIMLVIVHSNCCCFVMCRAYSVRVLSHAHAHTCVTKIDHTHTHRFPTTQHENKRRTTAHTECTVHAVCARNFYELCVHRAVYKRRRTVAQRCVDSRWCAQRHTEQMLENTASMLQRIGASAAGLTVGICTILVKKLTELPPYSAPFHSILLSFVRVLFDQSNIRCCCMHSLYLTRFKYYAIPLFWGDDWVSK